MQYFFGLQRDTIESTAVPAAIPFSVGKGSNRINDCSSCNVYSRFVHSFDTPQWRCANEARHTGHVRSNAIYWDTRWDSTFLSSSWPFPFQGKGFSFYRGYHPLKDEPRLKVYKFFHRKRTQLRISFNYSNSSRQ